MTNKNLTYTNQFRVKGHEVNQDRFQTIPALLAKIQETSLDHVRMLKASLWDLSEANLTWVLLRKKLTVLRPLELDEDFSVITYPSKMDKFFAHRDFLVFDRNKKMVSCASSVWTMINMETRKLDRIPENIQEIGVPKDLKFLIEPEKFKLIKNEFEEVDRYKIRNYDLDWNSHVSNLVLVRHMLESLKSQNINDQDMETILITFKNEAILNDNLSISKHQSEDKFQIKIENNSKLISACDVMTKN